MSYILDALRKADAERDRGNVPGIHAQPSFGSPAPTSAPPAAKPWPWLAAGALAVLLIGGLAWYLMSGPRRGAEAATAPPVAAPIAAAPVAPVTPPPAIARAPSAAPAPLPVIRSTRPTPTAMAATSAAAPPPEAAKQAATGEKIYTLAELPDDIRRQLPAVTVGGSMYSTKAADRILIINGQVLHEGDKIAPELTLQQIRLKGALLNFKGYRYTIAY